MTRSIFISQNQTAKSRIKYKLSTGSHISSYDGQLRLEIAPLVRFH